MKTYLLFIPIFFGGLAFGQHQKIQSAQFCMDNYRYAEAIEHLYDLYNNNKLESTALMADAYYRMRDFQHAQFYYELDLKNKNKLLSDQKLRYAHTLIMNERYDEAKQYLEQSEEIDLPNIHIDSLQNWMEGDTTYFIKKLDINSTTSEFATYIYENNLWVSQEKADKKNTYAWTGRPYFTIFEGPILDDGNVTELNPFPKLNATGHLANLTWDPNDKTYLFTTNKFKKKRLISDNSGEVKMEIDIASELNPDSVVSFEYNGQDFNTTHPFVSPDGKFLFFVSDMAGGYGGADIYFCEHMADGWSVPQNLGSHINTEKDELFPSLDKDYNLYFASEGHLGMGGLDIFKASYRGDKYWNKPNNMKSPINSSKDDFMYLEEYGELDKKVAAKGYFSSNRASSDGTDDIFFFRKLSDSNEMDTLAVAANENSADTLPVKKHIVSFVIVDDQTRQPLVNTEVIVKDLTTNREFEETSDANGLVSFEDDPGKKYEVIIEKEGYFRYANEEFDPEEDTSVGLYEEKINKPFRLQHIYYDLNSAALRPESKTQLDKVVDLLLSNPSMEIEMMSHTDSRASEKYNLDLSELRANSAAAYIRAHGIHPKRIQSRGYGESLLVNNCRDGVPCSEAEHQQNRRTEFKVIRYDKNQNKSPKENFK